MEYKGNIKTQIKEEFKIMYVKLVKYKIKYHHICTGLCECHVCHTPCVDNKNINLDLNQ